MFIKSKYERNFKRINTDLVQEYYARGDSQIRFVFDKNDPQEWDYDSEADRNNELEAIDHRFGLGNE